MLKRQEGHTLEHLCNGRIVLDSVNGGVEKLRAARYKEGGAVADFLRRALNRTVVVIMIAVIVFYKAVVTELIQGFLELFLAHAPVHFKKLLIGVPLTLLHFKRDINLVLAEDFAKSPVLLVGCL